MQGKQAAQSQQQLFNYTFLWTNEMSELVFKLRVADESCHCHSFWFVKLGAEMEIRETWYKVQNDGKRREFLMERNVL